MHHRSGRVGEPSKRNVGKSSGNPVAGNMMLDTLLEAGNVRVNSVVFQPGCRTWWHTHSEGQLFFIEHGRGMIATKDGQLQVVQAGDIVYTPPGEEHSHGAAPDSILVYTAASIGETNWLDEVADADYANFWR